MKQRIYYLYVVSFFSALLIFSGCQNTLQYAIPGSAQDSGKIKNLILVVGDGMGPQSVGLLNAYAKYAPHSIYRDKGRRTALEKLIEKGTLGYAYHEAAYVLVTDSAASATQIASGKRALSETIGIDQYGSPTETILEKAKKIGKSTGLVSDTRLTHATPAAFASHQPHRSKENAIAVDLLYNNVDVMLSAGLLHWIPQEANNEDSPINKQLKKLTGGHMKIQSKRKDNRNLLNEAVELGYTLAFTKDQLEYAQGNRLLGLFGTSDLPYGIDFDVNEPGRTIPSLKEMTMKALGILSKNENGFFLLVESGLIDWTSHDNDTGALLHELIKFDETLACIYEWVKKRNDTLLIVTADHETGGFSFSFSRRNVPQPINFPGELFRGVEFAPQYNFGSYDILDKIYTQKMSYVKMMKAFDALPQDNRTPEALADIVNAHTEFPITTSEASRILATEENEYYIEGHPKLGKKIVPKIDDFKTFYHDHKRMRNALLGRVVAQQQNTVWSTGTHSNTPVPLIAVGPKKATEVFSRMLHTTEWAQYAIEILINE
ncbi:MAG: alkaline phosphatase [bacterium]